MIKLSVNETKWSCLLARTRALILYISIWVFDFGPVKLPGRSRNGRLCLYIFIRGFSRAYTPLMFVCCSAFGVEDDNDILHCSWSQFGVSEGGWWGQSWRATLSHKLDTCELGWFAGCLQIWPCASRISFLRRQLYSAAWAPLWMRLRQVGRSE